MLTKNDVKKELDFCGCGPVIRMRGAAKLLQVGVHRIYELCSMGKLTKAGAGVISRDSLEQYIMENPRCFCSLYALNHPTTAEA